MAQGQGGVRYMQGIAVPSSSVRPQEFFARTRRHITTEGAKTYAGLAGQDIFELKKSDVLSGVIIRFTGSLTIAASTGSVDTTRRWPYDFLRTVRFTANGQSNLVNVSGLKLKAREFMADSDLSDKGIAQTIGGAAVQSGTLSRSSETWGVGSGVTGVAPGTYDVELEWFVPVAEDQVDLAGAIFAATSSTDLTLQLDYEGKSNLFLENGDGTADLTGQVQVTALKYSVPLGADGQIVVPDLSLFHSLIQTRHSSAVGQGENELRLIGQGAGKSLLRTYFQLWNGATPAPVVMGSDFSRQAWRYAGNETPDELLDGRALRMLNERQTSVDLGGQWGFGLHDFAAENAFRDVVDMGTTSDLRLVLGINNSLALTSPAVEIVQETIFAAGAGA